jgi:nucleoside-diphosphate-sugar epimerase
MTYFVTGATGFIGRYLVQSLLQRGKGTIYVLVRPKSIGKLDELREFCTQVCLFTIRAHTALDEIAGGARGLKPWLQEDRFPFWRNQVQDRLRRVADARAALNRSRRTIGKNG